MTKNSPLSPINQALDPFLLQSAGIEENGMTVSVLSALARLGLDPWVEGGRLAALPKQAAVLAITQILSLQGDVTFAAQLANSLPSRMAVIPSNRGMDRFRQAFRRNL